MDLMGPTSKGTGRAGRGGKGREGRGEKGGGAWKMLSENVD